MVNLRSIVYAQPGRYLSRAPAVFGYATAVLLVGISTAVSLQLIPLTYTTPYLYFYPAILLALWLAGFGPGLAATGLSAIAVDYFFIAPYHRSLGSTEDVVRAVYFVVSFGLICWLIDRRQNQAETELAHQAKVIDQAGEAQHVLEEQLRQAHKMEAVGRLAGGVAHDFNNLLMVILGQSELLAEQRDLPDRARRRIGDIAAAAERASELTKQLLAFSRKQILKMEPVDLNVVVQQFSNVLARLLGEDIRTEVILEPLLDLIRGDKNQLEQVLLNLAANSRDAMPHGGKFMIETARVTLDEQYCRTHVGVKPGRHVMLAVSDTGVGMTKETQQHIFEPFFTTKGQGQGTGLGLSMLYGIVKQLQGSVWVYSEIGKGTTFKMYFPTMTEGQLSIGLETVVEVPPERLKLTVLVVEDNDSLRALITDYLEVAGCQVLAAADGREAVGQAAQFRENIDVLLTDVVLPGKNGRQVAEEIKLQRPDTQVIFISGYTPNAIVHHGALEQDVDFLQKPFTRAELIARLRNVTKGRTEDPGFQQP